MSSLRKRSLLSSKRWQQTLAFSFLAILGAGSVVVFILSQRSQDVRQQANVDSSVTTILTSPPSNSQFLVNSKAEIQIIAQVPVQTKLDGIQYVANITGPIPADLTFVPTTISGLSLARNVLQDVSGGKQLQLGYLPAVASQPYTSTSTALVLGKLTFTPTTTGTISVSPDQNLTKIIEYATSQNLVASVQFSSYQVCSTNCATPTPLPTTPSPTATPFVPTPTPTATPFVPTPTPSFTPTPRPATPTPTPTPIFTPTPRPTNTPTPTPTSTPTPTPTLVPPTFTPTPTPRPASPTPTPTLFPSPRPTNTPTPTPTPTFSPTPSPTLVPSTSAPSPSSLPAFKSADLNQDGTVDLGDYTILSGNFLKAATQAEGDIDGDGMVTLADYTIWLNSIDF